MNQRIKLPLKAGPLMAGLLLGIASSQGLAADASGEAVGVTCSGCHGTDGVSKGSAPSLAGLPAKHLAQALMDFKSGKRPGSIMPRIAKGYSEAEMHNVGKYFAAMKK